MITKYARIGLILTIVFGVAGVTVGQQQTGDRPSFQTAAAANSQQPEVRVATLVYAGSKTSKCFSEKFLETTDRETNIKTAVRFDEVRLSKADLFEYPFAVMTGEGMFQLLEPERRNLKSYLQRGGFLLASAGCSSQEWNQSFRREMKRIFPDTPLEKVSLDHPIFQTVFDITSVGLKKSSGTAQLEGLELDGRVVVIYSPEGLNDTANVPGCCCCGGNEIRNSREVNVNVLTYALTH